MKKLLTVLMILISLSSSFIVLASDERNGNLNENITWSLDSNGILTLTGNGPMPEGTMPWANFKKDITAVVIGDGITSVSKTAFSKTNMQAITLPDTIESIGVQALAHTPLKALHIPKSVTSIDDTMIYNCTAFTGMTIDEQNTAYCIIDDVLYDINKTKLIYYPRNKENTDFTIMSTVTEILSKYLSRAKNLEVISVENGNTAFCSVDGVLYSADKKTIVSYPPKKTGETYIVPDGTEIIGDSCFDTSNLKHIILPDSLKEIESFAFRSHNLEEIIFPDTVTTLGRQIVNGCEMLTKVHLPENISIVPEEMFMSCTKLEEIIIPNTVTTIESQTFDDCQSLKTIYLSTDINLIMDMAFERCDNLTDVYCDITASDWLSKSITIEPDNDNFINATFHFKDYTGKLADMSGSPVDTQYSVDITLTIGETTALLNGETIENDAAPQIVNSRTMLPIRFIAEALGSKVSWDGEKQLVTITSNENTILITIGSNTAIVNGIETQLDSPAFIENGRTYLPVRFISEALGAKVDWNGELQTVRVTK